MLIQSLATMEYLEETHPKPAILPNQPAARAYVRAIAQMVACEMHPLNNLRTLKYLENTLGCDQDARQAWYAHWIAEGFTAIEALLVERGLAGRYCYGDQVTMADACLVPQVFNGRRFDWGPGDTFVVPSWAVVEHEASAAADVFAITDRPVLEALGLYREETLDEAQEISSRFEG